MGLKVKAIERNVSFVKDGDPVRTIKKMCIYARKLNRLLRIPIKKTIFVEQNTAYGRKKVKYFI